MFMDLPEPIRSSLNDFLTVRGPSSLVIWESGSKGLVYTKWSQAMYGFAGTTMTPQSVGLPITILGITAILNQMGFSTLEARGPLTAIVAWRGCRGGLTRNYHTKICEALST